VTAGVVFTGQEKNAPPPPKTSGEKLPRVLIVGVFASAWRPYRGVCEDLASQLESDGVSVVTTSSRSSGAARAADMLVTAWRRRDDYEVAQVDVYSGRAFNWAEAVCGLMKLLKKPFVLTLHGGNLPDFAAQHRRRVGRLLNAAVAVTAPSAYLANGLRGFREDIRLIPNPIFVRRYPFRLRQSASPRLIWLRAFHRIYDPSLAVTVLAEVAREWPAATLVMVGPDKHDGSLSKAREDADRRGVADRIRFVGGVPNSDVPTWLSAGDVFLNTARVDNAPISVIEAMACGLCVVSTKVGGLPFLLEEGREALLVPPEDPAAMVGAVRRVLAEPPVACSLSRNGRAKAEGFDWSRALPEWERILQAAKER
jgi:glycosyltransferase involved in cell wall biosynthesis